MTFNRRDAEARPLALEVIRGAVRDWRRARSLASWAGKIRAEAETPDRPDPGCPEGREWSRWGLEVGRELIAREARLAALVLLLHGRVEHSDGAGNLPPGWPPCSLDIDGHLLIVHPVSESDPRPRLMLVRPEDVDFDSDGDLRKLSRRMRGNVRPRCKAARLPRLHSNARRPAGLYTLAGRFPWLSVTGRDGRLSDGRLLDMSTECPRLLREWHDRPSDASGPRCSRSSPLRSRRRSPFTRGPPPGQGPLTPTNGTTHDGGRS
jgi:hypothetical protein